MMKIIVKIIRLMYRLSVLLLIAALIAGMAAPLVNPYYFWPMAFPGLAYPLLWTALLIAILPLIRQKRWFRGALLVLIAGLPQMTSHFMWSSGSETTPESSDLYTLISYNTLGFSDRDGNFSNYNVQFEAHDFFKEENADIICMQEYPIRKGSVKMYRKNMNLNPPLPGNHFSWYQPGSIYLENVLLTSSAYRIINRGAVFTFDDDDYAIYSDIEFPEGTVRVYNIHLQSLLLKGERSLLNDSPSAYLKRSALQKGFLTIRKLKRAFVKRSYQAKGIAASIRESPWPVIVAGDFNDTPGSFARHTISRGLCDAFNAAGRGFSATYALSHYPLRIDYVLTSPGIKVYSYERRKTGYSDHYPVIVRFSIENGEKH